MTPARLTAGTAVLLAAGLALFAQPPVFRSGVDLVAVDTLVVDDEGRPIVGLERGDFILEVDGRSRPIESAQFIATPAADLTAAPRFARDVSSNDVSGLGRLVLIVVDRTNLRRGEGSQAMAGLARFVERLSPADRVGLYTFPSGGPRVALTSDRRAVLSALPGIRGTEERQVAPFITLTVSEAFRIDRSDRTAKTAAIDRNCVGLGTPPANDDPDSPRATRIELCAQQIDLEARTIVRETRLRNEETLSRLEALLESLRYVEGQKVVVFVSEGLALDLQMRGRLRAFGSSVAATGTSFYGVQLFVPPIDTLANGDRPDWEEDRALRAEGLSFVAGISGGALFRPGPDLRMTFDRVARELSARYVLSFAVSPSERDGKSHAISVKLRDPRSARVLRHRTEFQLPTQPTRFRRSAETLAAALSEPLPLSALPIRVTTYAVPEAASQYKVIVASEIGAAEDQPGPAQTAFEVFDAEGRRVAAGEDALAASGPMPLRYTTAVRLSPGNYRLKLAAKDGSGRMGSVEHALDVQPAGDLALSLSSLMLFRSIEEGDEAQPALVFDLASPQRVFGAHVIARAAREPAFADTRAVLQVDDVSNGVLRASRTMTLVDGATPDQKGFETKVSTRGWPAGDYLATVTVLRGEETIGRVSRTLTLRDAPPGDSEAAPTAEAAAATPSLERTRALLARATRYVEGYAERASSVVAEERYVQAIVAAPAGRPIAPVEDVVAWRDDASKARDRAPGVTARRQLRSDLLMVRTAGGFYTNYRDVSDVDGKPVKDRDRRALSLFTAHPDQAGATLRRIAEEGARYNLGNLRRTINVPTLPLFALHPAHVARFAFDAAGREPVDGIETTIVRFREQRAPTFVTTPRGADVFTNGKIWIADDGRILKTSLAIHERDSGMQIAVDVTYREAADLGLVMPAEMRELYSNLPGDARRVITGRATYTNFRKFVVEVAESGR